MQDSKSINYMEAGPEFMTAFEDIMKIIRSKGVDISLYHLVLLRASQINKCGFCVKMHTREAREDGESNERLDQIVIWPQSNVYSDKEKAAFAWTDALTENRDHTIFAPIRAQLREHYSDEEIATLTALICMINVWNRIGVSNH